MINHSDSVHEAMQRAIDKSTPSDMTALSLKASKQDIERAHGICERHGVTLSSFLRECLEVLVDEYYPPKAQ